MDQELKEKLEVIDQQIRVEKDLYIELCNTELGHKANWRYTTENREKEIFDKIHQLQLAKQRLVTGEKAPEIVYVDRPVETIKYITTKEIHVYKSSLASVVAWGSVLILVTLGAAHYFRYFTVTFNF